MEMSRDAGSIPAASIKAACERNRKLPFLLDLGVVLRGAISPKIGRGCLFSGVLGAFLG
jgi:hypothetical protein